MTVRYITHPFKHGEEVHVLGWGPGPHFVFLFQKGDVATVGKRRGNSRMEIDARRLYRTRPFGGRDQYGHRPSREARLATTWKRPAFGERSEPVIPTCPGCGQEAERQHTKWGIRDACPQCEMWSWGGAPLVDGATHEARKAAHAAFDPLWQSELISRPDAYELLAAELGLAPEQCHIKLMSVGTARRVPDAVKRICQQVTETLTTVTQP